MNARAPILIGHDGSRFSRAAARRGLSLARALGLPAHILRSWSISTAPRPATWSPGFVPPREDFAAAVAEALRQDVAPLLAEYPDVQVSFETPHGAAGRELIRASEQAEVLVVGTRGLGGFAGLLLGSVSDQCVEHAACDVLVVRTPGIDQAPGRTLPLDATLEG